MAVKYIMLFFMICCAAVSGREWQPGNKTLNQWTPAWRVKCRNTADGNLLLYEIGADSSIQCSGVNWKPSSGDVLEVEYRASGGIYTNGQFYFRSENNDFSDERVWTLPAMIGDGQWHTMRVKTGNIRNLDAWINSPVVTGLRLDLSDGSGGTVEIARIALHAQAPRPKKDLAGLLDAPVWPRVKPEVTGQELQKIRSPYFSGQMIAHPEDGRKPGTFFLRKSFELKEMPVYATLTVSADDSATSYLNGKKALTSKNWEKPDIAEVTKYLKTGKNVIAFNYTNSDFAGGVLAELQMRMPDGSCRRIVTDRTFSVTRNQLPGWETADFQVKNWETPVELGVPPCDPWRKKLRFEDIRYDWKVLSVTPLKQSYNAGETAEIRMRIRGHLPDFPLVMELKLVTDQGFELPSKEFVINREDVIAADGCWESVIRCQLPRWMECNSFTLTAETGCAIDGKIRCSFGFIPQKRDVLPENMRSEIRRTANGLRLFLNSKECYPVIGCVPVNSGADPMALELRVVFPFGYSAWWTGRKKYNFAAFDLAAEHAASMYPDAKFLIQIPLYMPMDWPDQHPDQMSCTESGRLGNSMGSNEVPHSFSSRIAFEEMRCAVRAAVEYLENSPYRDRIAGYRIAGGMTAEWIGWGHNGKLLMDYSKPAKKAFAEYAAEHFPGTGISAIPSQAARLSRSPNQDDLLDPENRMADIAYNYFYSDSIADVVIEMCRIAKTACGNSKIVGSYYGYIFCLTLSEYPQNSGHLALHKLLKSGAVDFLMSPPSYAIRRLGYAMTDMKPFATIEKYGVLPIIENDPRTHSMPLLPAGMSYNQALNLEQSLQVLQRDFGIALCRLQPILMYSYVGIYHSEFSFPEMRPLTDQAIAAGKHMLKNNTRRRAEIALVVSEDSIKFLALENRYIYSGQWMQTYTPSGEAVSWPEGTLRLTGPLLSGQLDQLSRSGAPCDYILAEDLEKHLDNYKLYIFAGCFRYDDRFLEAVQKLRKKEVTLFWLYAPGIFRNFDRNLRNMETLTGFRFQMHDELPAELSLGKGNFLGLENELLRPGFSIPPQPGVKRLYNYTDTRFCGYAEKSEPDGALSIFCGAYRIPWHFYMNLARRAGVHIFTEGGDPMEANEHMLTLHARFPGVKTVKLPGKADVIDVYHGRKIASGVESFTFDAPLHSSWLFYFGPDGNDLLKKISGRLEP